MWIENSNRSMSVSLMMLKVTGFWAPNNLGDKQKYYNLYTLAVFIFILGTNLLFQIVDLILNWGNIELMTAVAFVLFTNLAQTAKIVNLVLRKRKIEAIIHDVDEVLMSQEGEAAEITKRCDNSTWRFLLLYVGLTTITVGGWALSAEKNMLPIRAWYPYNTTESPAYELTYCHQVGGLFLAAYLNVAKDTLVVTIIAQNRCRLQLLGFALTKLHEGVNMDEMDRGNITPEQNKELNHRLRGCIKSHQAALQAIKGIQECFSAPTFAQFSVSMVIICVTAFQLAANTSNLVRFLSMFTYLLNMTFQVYLYCYHGNKLTEESSEVCGKAYSCIWYRSPLAWRKSLLMMMTRTCRVASLSAGGFTTLSLASFMAIIKTSYSLFTLLKQMEDKSG